MRKNIFVKLLVGLLVLGMVTGCNKSENSKTALAVVVGDHENSMEIPRGAPTVKKELYRCCSTYGSVAFVCVDGDPKMYYQTDIPEPEVRGLTESKKKSIANRFTEQLLVEIQRAHPQVAEVDTLKAIKLAAFSLQGSDESVDKVMVIMDSGLSTTGYLDFTEGLLSADVEDIIKNLKKEEALPLLQDIRIVWMYIGQTASPQEELSDKQKNKLREIWETVLLEGGAKSVDFASDIASELSDENYPNVSIVDVEEQSIEVEIGDLIDIFVLDNERVQFVGDKAVFVDEELAMESIKEVAEKLIDHPNNKVYVIGTTASGDREFCEWLSTERAQAVTEVLIDMGVSPSQLQPMGLGFNDPWHENDLDETGRQIEEKASQNRKVMVIDVNGDEAKKLK
ncbi:MAG: OmpA family protein [Lachnospiraceae bacterium]|nr:OmpA family protein [Lachnospiraceae bacterium]